MAAQLILFALVGFTLVRATNWPAANAAVWRTPPGLVRRLVGSPRGPVPLEAVLIWLFLAIWIVAGVVGLFDDHAVMYEALVRLGLIPCVVAAILILYRAVATR